jgi:hypothetical protein
MWTASSFFFFITIHNAFVFVDSNSSISVTIQKQTQIHIHFFSYNTITSPYTEPFPRTSLYITHISFIFFSTYNCVQPESGFIYAETCGRDWVFNDDLCFTAIDWYVCEPLTNQAQWYFIYTCLAECIC